MSVVDLNDAIAASVVGAIATALEPLIDVLNRVDRQPERLVYTPAECADVLGVSPQTIRKWLDKGVLPRLPHTDRVLIPRVAVESFVAAAAKGRAGVSATREGVDGRRVSPSSAPMAGTKAPARTPDAAA